MVAAAGSPPNLCHLEIPPLATPNGGKRNYSRASPFDANSAEHPPRRRKPNFDEMIEKMTLVVSSTCEAVASNNG